MNDEMNRCGKIQPYGSVFSTRLYMRPILQPEHALLAMGPYAEH